MSDADEAKALLTRQCCKNCFYFFDSQYESKKYDYFCSNDDALQGGYLQIIGRLRNGTKQYNVCKYFDDIDNPRPAPIYSAFPVFNEEETNEK